MSEEELTDLFEKNFDLMKEKNRPLIKKFLVVASSKFFGGLFNKILPHLKDEEVNNLYGNPEIFFPQYYCNPEEESKETLLYGMLRFLHIRLIIMGAPPERKNIFISMMEAVLERADEYSLNHACDYGGI